MRARPLTVHWHKDNLPIYSAQFQPNEMAPVGYSARFATAGGDNTVRLWRLGLGSNFGSVVYLATLSEHVQAVNVVRFKPNGETLASAGDDGSVLLWALNTNTDQRPLSETEDVETWKVVRTCKSGASDIYDLCWSPDGNYIATGSMDNVVRVFDAQTGQCIHTLSDHGHYVQGIAWDPFDGYLVSQSSDRSINVYELDNDQQALGIKAPKKVSRTVMPSAAGDLAASHKPSEDGKNEDKPEDRVAHFHNETFPSFFRRLTFSPDGSLLLAPAGQLKEPNQEYANVAYIYSRAGLGHPPVGILKGTDKPSLAVRFSPVVYELTTDGSATIHLTMGDINSSETVGERPLQDPETRAQNAPIENSTTATSPEANQGCMFTLPYRMIYAVAMPDSVIIYDTQHMEPIAMVSNLHYSSFTDLSWSPGGDLLLMTSTDGYCSAIEFGEGELGKPYTAKINIPQSPTRSRKKSNGAPPSAGSDPPKPIVNWLTAKKKRRVEPTDEKTVQTPAQNAGEGSQGVKMEAKSKPEAKLEAKQEASNTTNAAGQTGAAGAGAVQIPAQEADQ